MHSVQMIPNDQMSAFFEATAEATEESIINAQLTARTMIGTNGFTVHALPHDRLLEVLRKYNK
jgi:L-aminopeptidase/D-esterase-like protein